MDHVDGASLVEVSVQSVGLAGEISGAGRANYDGESQDKRRQQP